MFTGKKLMDDVRAYQARDGELAFWWLGQLGFIVKIQDVVLVLDPFLKPMPSRLVPPLLEPEDLEGVDFVFGTHNHIDHIDSYLWPRLAKVSPNTRFVAPEMFVESLVEKFDIPVDRFISMDDGRSFYDEARDVRISAIPAAHEFLDTDPITGLHPSLSFLVECHGLRILHTGDTCRYEGQESRMLAMGPLDVLMLPINGRDGLKYRNHIIGNMDFREAVDLAGTLAPRLAIPGHYDMFASNSANPIDFIDFMEAKYPDQKMWIGGHGVRFILDKDA